MTGPVPGPPPLVPKPQKPVTYPWDHAETVDKMQMHRETRINRIVEKATNSLRATLDNADIITPYEKFVITVDVQVIVA